MSTLQLTALRMLTITLVVAALAVLAPLWAPLVLAAWFTDLLAPLVRRLERLLGGKRRSAAAIVALLSVAVVVPLSILGFAVFGMLREIYDQARAAMEGEGTLAGMVDGAAQARHLGLEDWTGIVSRYGSNAWQVATTVARLSAKLALGIFVFGFALYTFTASGDRAYLWLEHALPFGPAVLRRLASAFRETGRGLIVGAGGTALAQGIVAATAFAVLGIPRAFVLGTLTAACAFIPVIGTALVWAPIATELALAGQLGRAAAVVVIGIALIGTIDNILRPVLTRYGHLRLPTFVVLIAIVGGVATFGPLGALLGPLAVRLAVEALAIAREEHVFDRSPERREAAGTEPDAVGAKDARAA